MKTIPFLLALLLIRPTIVSAATYYVSPDGNDGWNRSLSELEIKPIFESHAPISCSQSIHRADDRPPLGCVTMPELVDWIGNWKGDSKEYPMGELMEAVSLWKSPGAECQA